LNVLLAILGLTAVATLILQYGGFDPDRLPVGRTTLAVFQACIVGWFLLDHFLRLALVRRKKEYLRHNWLDYSLIVLFVVALAVAYRYREDVVSAGALYLIVTQGYLLAVLILRAINANIRLAGSGLPPSWLIIGSFASLSLIGSGLLMLPAAVRPESPEPWAYPDALFTAVSATCVTGLIVVDTGSHFTPFGQAVILGLIQLGGLGIMIFGTMLALLAGKALSVRSTEVLGEMLAHERVGETGRIIRFVVFFTLCMEAVGAVLLLEMYRDVPNVFGRAMGLGEAIWHSVFHSISAFCNAGFSLYTNSMMHGVRAGWTQPLRAHWQIMGVMAPLIVLGGVGFPVLDDLQRVVRTLGRRAWFRLRKHRRGLIARPPIRLTLHSKIVLTSTAVLIVLGALFLLVVARPVPGNAPDAELAETGGDPPADWPSMSWPIRLRAAVFSSITARTAGFNTIDMNELSVPAKLWMCGLMSIGGSPASTAGGMKTVTVALVVIAAWSVLRRRSEIEIFRRSIADVVLRRAVTLIMLYSLLVVLVTMLLAMSMEGEKLIDLLFEACSACGTVGLSTGVTTRVGTFEKFVIMAGMFIGRVGPLTLILALAARVKPVNYTYPSENVVIG
jgi:trk system potassium uptake protein TrkH